MLSNDEIYCEAEELVKVLEDTYNSNPLINREIVKLILDNYDIDIEGEIWKNHRYFITKIYNINDYDFHCQVISDRFNNIEFYEYCIEYDGYSVDHFKLINLYRVRDNYDYFLMDSKLYEIVKDKKWDD